MAEALGVAASIAGLISLADTVVRLGFKYFKDVKSAPESIEKLIRETNNLAGILHSLRNVVEILEAKYQSDTSVQVHGINACQKTLDAIEDRLNKLLSKGASTKYKWPFEKSAVEGLIRDIESHKTAMAIAMDAKEMSVLINLLDGQQNIMHGLASVQATLKSGQEEWKKIELNETRRKLLGLLGTLDVQKWQNMNIRLRQPGTGVWFTDGSEFQSWLSASCSKLWVHGIAGAGKTVLIASAIQEIEKIFQSSSKHATAIFYCDYKDSKTHDPRIILGTLARQLIVRHKDCFAQLERFCKAHNMDEHTLGSATLEDIRDFIIELSYNFDSVSIVVDGLDEISDDRADVTALLDSLNTSCGRIRTLLASRKEVDIERVLLTYPKISIAAQSADLRLYVRSEIDKRSNKGKLRIQDPDLKDHIIKVLTEGADGMFRWVACQIDYLCECSTDDDRRDALQKLPPDLPSSYERILERVNRSTPENQAIVRRALQWIVYSFEFYPDKIYRRKPDNGKPLHFETCRFGTVELLQALSVRPDARVFKKSSMPEEDRVLDWCSSLIRQKADGTGFEIAHFTVEEFLFAINPIEKPEFAQYRLSGDQAELGITCMTFLRYAEFDGLPSPIGVFDTEDFNISWNNLALKCPFAVYSVRYWYDHILESQWDEVERATLDFLDQNASDSLWKLEKCQNDLWNGGYHFMGPQNHMTTTESLLKTLSPLHWASMFALPNACWSLISERGADVNRQSLAGTPMCCAITTSTICLNSKIPHRGEEMTLCETFELGAIEKVLKLLVAAGADFETKIDPNEKCAALLLAMEYVSRSQFFETEVVLALLHAGAWFSREHALFVLGNKYFDDEANNYSDYQESTLCKILEWAAGTDLKFVSKDAFPTFFILVFDSLVFWSDCSDELMSKLHTWMDENTVGDSFTFRYKNIFPGPDGEALHYFSSEQCKSDLVEPETPESETSESETCELEISESIGLRRAKQLSLAIRISSKNLVSSVEPAIFALIIWDRTHVVSFLLHNGVELDFDWVGPNGNSILHTFLDRADVSCLRDTILFDLLLSQGINFDKVDSNGRHCLEILAAPQKLSMFRKMLNDINVPDMFARSPGLPLKILRAAGKHGTSAEVLRVTISKLLECRSAYRAIVRESKDSFMSEVSRLNKDRGGNTKMHLLSGNHNPHAFIELMEVIWEDAHESEIHTLNGINLTPLAIAVRSKNTVAMKLLLHAGVNTMQRLQNGQTVLHLACMLGNDEAVKTLLQTGVDVSMKDDFGHTAADVAKQNGQTRLAALIQDHIGDSLDVEGSVHFSDRDLDNQFGTDTMIDGDPEAMDWAPEADPTPAAVNSASLDQNRANTLKLVHRPSKEAIRSVEDLGIGEGLMIWEVDRPK